MIVLGYCLSNCYGYLNYLVIICNCYQKLYLNTTRKEVRDKQKLILILFLSPTFRRLVASYTTKIIFYNCYLPPDLSHCELTATILEDPTVVPMDHSALVEDEVIVVETPILCLLSHILWSFTLFLPS